MKQDIYLGMRLVHVNVDSTQVFLTINNTGIKIKCGYECKKLIGKVICDKGFNCYPSICDCECDKSCDVRECLDYENCKYRKKIVDKLVDNL